VTFLANWRWLDPGDWYPASRGRNFEFSLPAFALIGVIRDVERASGQELTLLTCEKVRIEGLYHSIYRDSRWSALEDETEWQHFIRSRSLTPTLPSPAPLKGVGWPRAFAANGLISLWHPDPGSPNRDRRVSSIGIIPRVRHAATGELRLHTDYDSVYRLLKRELSRRERATVRPDIDANVRD
jgi:hypothetical protein